MFIKFYFQSEEPLLVQNDPLECTADEYTALVKTELNDFEEEFRSSEKALDMKSNGETSGRQAMHRGAMKLECVSVRFSVKTLFIAHFCNNFTGQ